jgi:hypothetical protein
MEKTHVHYFENFESQTQKGDEMRFAELLEQHDIPYRVAGQHHHAREGWVQFDCPFCHGPSRFRMGYNEAGRFCNCWTCGTHKLIEVLQQILPPSAIPVALLTLETKSAPRIEEPVGRLIEPQTDKSFSVAHRNYLHGRGFDVDELLKLWRLRSISIDAKLAWRIYIPIEYRGKTVSWTTRTIGNAIGAKYLTAKRIEEAIHHKRLLYGQDYARNAIVIVEGPGDVWRIGPGAVATFGLNVSKEQILKLTEYPRRVICFDNEPDAQQVARKLATDLMVFPGETIVHELETSKDPGSASERELTELRAYLTA